VIDVSRGVFGEFWIILLDHTAKDKHCFISEVIINFS